MSEVSSIIISAPSKEQRRLLFTIIKDGISSATQLSRILKRPRTSLIYHLQLLEHSGFLRSFKDARNRVYAMTPKGEQFVRSGSRGVNKPFGQTLAMSDEQVDRCHALYLKSKIQRMPEDKDLIKIGFTKGSRMKNWGQEWYGLRMEHCSVQITPRHFLFFLDEIFASDSHIATLLAYELVAGAITSLQEALPGLVLGEPERLAFMVRQHHALQEDFLAKQCRGDGISIKTERFEIDSSKGLPEIEFVDPQLAAEDFDTYTKAQRQVKPEAAMELVNETISGRFSPKKVTTDIDKLTEITQDVKNILNRMVPPGNQPSSDPGAMHQ